MSREATEPCRYENGIRHQMVDMYIWTIRKHRKIVEHSIADTGVYRSQHQMLMYLAKNANVSQKELAEDLRISTATVAVTLKKLEKGGYIHRETDQKDTRCNQICLTEKGQQVVKESVQIFQRIEQAMFEGFCEEECEKMLTFLERIHENLEVYEQKYFEVERED